MGQMSLNRWESEVQSRLAEGKYAEAKRSLEEAGTQIRFLHRTIFEAAIGLAEGDFGGGMESHFRRT